MNKYQISGIQNYSGIGDILSAIFDSSKTLGLTPAIASEVRQPVGGLIWLLRKGENSGHLEVLYDPGLNEIIVTPVSKTDEDWVHSHALLVAEYLSDRLGGHLSGK